jgi:hypothetical protein
MDLSRFRITVRPLVFVRLLSQGQDGDLLVTFLATAALLCPGPRLFRSVLPEVDTMSEPVAGVFTLLVPLKTLDDPEGGGLPRTVVSGDGTVVVRETRHHPGLSLLLRPDRRAIDRVLAEFLLDPEELVVLGDPVGAAGETNPRI